MGGKKALLVAAFLTWIAGFVDAVSYLSLGKIYTANMSGDSVSFGIHSALQNWPEAIRHGWPVLLYVAGLLFGRLLIEVGARERIRSIASISFLSEIVLLLPVCLYTPEVKATSHLGFALVGLLAAAMGVQNGALTHFGSMTLHTGFVTGTLVKTAEETAKYLAWLFDQARAPGMSLFRALGRSGNQSSFQWAAFLLGIWICYVAGACCGTFGDHGFSFKSLVVPIGGLALLILVDLYTPLALKEEKERSKSGD